MMDGFPPEQKGLGVAKPEDLQNANRPNQYAEETHGHLGRPRHGSKLFYDLLQEMAETHDAKSHDYASDSNPFGNYQFAGKLSAMFSHSPDDAGFVGRLAEKIYRLANLERDGKIPKSESISDTEKDIAVITTLWMASRRQKRLKDKLLNQGPGSIIHTSPHEGAD